MASDRVLASLSGETAFGARALGRRVDSLWHRLLVHCPTPSRQGRAFAAQVHRSVAEPLDGPGLDAVLAYYRDWAAVVGLRPKAERLIEDRAACLRLASKVRASYTVRWEPTSRGKAFWVQMIVQNDTDKGMEALFAGSARHHYGYPWSSLWVADPLGYGGGPDTMHHGRLASHLNWGYDTADRMFARAHARSTGVAVFGEDWRIQVGPNGTVFDVRPVMDLGGCTVPVQHDP